MLVVSNWKPRGGGLVRARALKNLSSGQSEHSSRLLGLTFRKYRRFSEGVNWPLHRSRHSMAGEPRGVRCRTRFASLFSTWRPFKQKMRRQEQAPNGLSHDWDSTSPLLKCLLSASDWNSALVRSRQAAALWIHVVAPQKLRSWSVLQESPLSPQPHKRNWMNRQASPGTVRSEQRARYITNSKSQRPRSREHPQCFGGVEKESLRVKGYVAKTSPLALVVLGCD